MLNKIDKPTILEIAMTSFGGYAPGNNDEIFYFHRFEMYKKKVDDSPVNYLIKASQIKFELEFINEERILTNKILRLLNVEEDVIYSKILAYKIFIKSKRGKLQAAYKKLLLNIKPPTSETLFANNNEFCKLFNSIEKRSYFLDLMITKWNIIDSNGNYILGHKKKYQVFALVDAGCEISYFTSNYHNPTYKIIVETIGVEFSNMRKDQNDYSNFKDGCKLALNEYKG